MKLLIFDFDGPINDLTSAKKVVADDAAKDLNLKWSEENSWELINYIDQIYEAEKIYNYKELINKSLSKMAVNKLVYLSDQEIDSFSESFSEKINKVQSISKDIQFIIKELKRKYEGVNICIYTSQTESNVTKLLTASGIELRLFDKIYDRNYFEEQKPSTVNLLKICGDFNVTPEEVTVIGDNVAVDLAPASYLKMRTILVNPFVTQSISSLHEIKEVLE